jgi:hypothetical protein
MSAHTDAEFDETWKQIQSLMNENKEVNWNHFALEEKDLMPIVMQIEPKNMAPLYRYHLLLKQ